MTHQLFLDRQTFINALHKQGFPSVRAFIDQAGIHRNSIAQYLSHERGVFTDLFERICEKLNIEDPLTLIAKGVESSGVLNSTKLITTLQSISKRHPSLAFVLIGSRAAGSAKEYSDWDIGLTTGESPLQSELYLSLKTEIEDLTDDFAQSCDVVNLDSAPCWFFNEMNYRPLYLTGSRESYIYFMGMIDGITKAGENNQSAKTA
jgi:hypothetical protein